MFKITTNLNKILKYLTFLSIIFTLIAPVWVQAQLDAGEYGTNPPPDDTGTNPPPISMKIEFKNPFKEDTIEGLIKVVINDILIPVGGVIAVVMIMYSGFLFVTARGNSSQIEKARKALLYAVIGAAILLGAWTISTAIQKTIGELRI